MGIATKNTQENLDNLRAKIRSIEGGNGLFHRAFTQSSSPVAVPPWLRSALSNTQGVSNVGEGGGLPRGAVTRMSNCPSVLVHLLAAVTASGGCAAIVEHPNLSIAAIEAAGGDIERLVVVPDASPHTAAVLSTLVEGMDMVVYKTANTAEGQPRAERSIPISDRHSLQDTGGLNRVCIRSVESKLRKSQCALIVCGQWPTAQLHIDVRVSGVAGLGKGSGRVRSLELQGKTWGKSLPPRSFSACLGSSWDSGDHASSSQQLLVADVMDRMAQ